MALFPEIWDAFSVGDVEEMLGIARRKVMLFVEQKIITPAGPSTGRGHHRKFNISNLAQFCIVSRLERLGISPRYMRTFMEIINAQKPILAYADRAERSNRAVAKAPEGGKLAASFLAEGIHYDFMVLALTEDQKSSELDCAVSLHHLGLVDFGSPENSTNKHLLLEQALSMSKLADELVDKRVVVVISLAQIYMNVLTEVEKFWKEQGNF